MHTWSFDVKERNLQEVMCLSGYAELTNYRGLSYFSHVLIDKKKKKEACFIRVSNVYFTPFSVDSRFSQSIKENCNRVEVGWTWLHVNKGVTWVYSEQGTGTVDLEQHFYIIAKNERATKQNETEEAHQCHYLGILKKL